MIRFKKALLRFNRRSLIVGLAVTMIPLVALSAQLTLPNTFVNGEVADADAVNENFFALEDEANDKDDRITLLEGDADDHENRIAFQEDRVSSITVVLNDDGTPQYVSRSGLTIARTSTGDYSITLPSGAQGSTNARPIVTVMPLGQRYVAQSITSFSGGRWTITLKFRNFSGNDADTIFHAVFHIGS